MTDSGSPADQVSHATTTYGDARSWQTQNSRYDAVVQWEIPNVSCDWGEVLGRTDRQFRAASGPQDFAGGLHDVTGGYPRRVHELRGGSGAR